MLSVKYATDVPPAMADLLEHHAREAGLSLDALEVIGASLDYVEAFIVAAEDGRGAQFVARLGLGNDKVARARWQAARLFGA
jgi:hypothetical protein